MQQVWRKDVIRHYAVADETIPVMLLGLKRDLREEGEGVIYPQEVSGHWNWLDRGMFRDRKLMVVKGISDRSRDAV